MALNARMEQMWDRSPADEGEVVSTVGMTVQFDGGEPIAVLWWFELALELFDRRLAIWSAGPGEQAEGRSRTGLRDSVQPKA